MGISLRNSMKLGRFSECKVVAGHDGLDRIIENITIMEVPDIVKWLKGRELILTSLFAIKDDVDAQNLLIHKLYYAGATALAIKPFESINDIPEGIITNANKLGFPVIEIPEDVLYLDILSPVMHHIFNEKVVLQEDIERATSVLQEISLNSQGIDVFIENVSNITNNIVTIESEFLYIKTPTPLKSISSLSKEEKHELSILKRPIRHERKYDEKLVSCIVAPIMVDGAYFGNITSWEVKHEHVAMDVAVLEKAASLLSIEFLKLKLKYELEQQSKNDFIRELLFNESISEEYMLERGAEYQLTKEGRYYCMLIGEELAANRPDNPVIECSVVCTLLQEEYPQILVGNVGNKLCLVIPFKAKKAHQLTEDMYALIQKHVADSALLCAGVGEVYQGLEGIKKSFFQAEQAYKLKLINKKLSRIVYYKELGTYRLLGSLLGTRELKEFYEDTIGKLIENDPKKELLHTLMSYFQNNEKIKGTAEALFIHVNTLKYRMKRVEQITGLKLKNTDDKVTLYLGLKIYELSNELG